MILSVRSFSEGRLGVKYQGIGRLVSNVVRFPTAGLSALAEHPFLLAQFQRANDGGVVVESSLCRS